MAAINLLHIYGEPCGRRRRWVWGRWFGGSPTWAIGCLFWGRFGVLKWGTCWFKMGTILCSWKSRFDWYIPLCWAPVTEETKSKVDPGEVPVTEEQNSKVDPGEVPLRKKQIQNPSPHKPFRPRFEKFIHCPGRDSGCSFT